MNERSLDHAPAPANRRRWVRRAFWIGLLVSICLTAYFTFSTINRHQQLEWAAFESAQEQATLAARQVNEIFINASQIAAAIANDLSSGQLAYADIDARMQAELSANPGVDGLAVTFAPYVYDPQRRLYQSYHYVNADGSLGNLTGATYDYTSPTDSGPDGPETAWYHVPLNEGPTWDEPFLATGAQEVLIEYGVPFYQPDLPEEPGGVVTIDYSLAGMHEIMDRLDLGATGYGYVISQSGLLLAHPIDDYVARRTIFDLAANSQDAVLADGAAQALGGTSLWLDDIDTFTGEESWVFFEPIPVTDWVLGIVWNKAELLSNARTRLINQTALVLAAAATLFFIASLHFHLERETNKSLWLVSSTLTLLYGAVVVVVLALSASTPFQNGVAVTSQTAVNRYIQDYMNARGIHEQPLRIPTGILVQTVDFPDPTTVMMNGYIWQRYTDSLPDDLNRGFRLAQQFGEEYTLEETQRIEEGAETLIVWYFGVALKQSFNPAQFPFDSRSIAIHIAPLDIQHNVILTPDLAAYDLINPSLLPGIDQNLFINNWQVVSSFFSYQEGDNTTGSPDVFAFLDQPELFYSINVRRIFFGPLIAYLLPGIVAAGLMFAFLISDPKVGDQEEIVATLSFAAAIFFVITVAHTALRESVAAVGLTYMEYFYILLYLAIILTSVNAFLVVRRPDLPFFQFRNNLIPKLLFWPSFAGIFMLVTLGIFVFS